MEITIGAPLDLSVVTYATVLSESHGAACVLDGTNDLLRVVKRNGCVRISVKYPNGEGRHCPSLFCRSESGDGNDCRKPIRVKRCETICPAAPKRLPGE